MSERAIESRRFENAEHLIQSLKELVCFSGQHPSTVYVRGEFHHHGLATLMEETLTDGSKVYNIAISSR